MIEQPELAEQPMDLGLGKTETGAERRVQQRVDAEVVETGEDAIAPDAQDPGHHAALEV
jgi:hypothetical protein